MYEENNNEDGFSLQSSPLNEEFAIVPRSALRPQKGLTLKARGLLATLLSLSPNWNLNKKGLQKVCAPDGLDSITAGWKELKKAGYITGGKVLGEKGRIAGWRYYVHRTPLSVEHLNDVKSDPETGLPLMVDPVLAEKNAGIENQSLKGRPEVGSPEVENPLLRDNVLEELHHQQQQSARARTCEGISVEHSEQPEEKEKIFAAGARLTKTIVDDPVPAELEKDPDDLPHESEKYRRERLREMFDRARIAHAVEMTPELIETQISLFLNSYCDQAVNKCGRLVNGWVRNLNNPPPERTPKPTYANSNSSSPQNKTYARTQSTTQTTGQSNLELFRRRDGTLGTSAARTEMLKDWPYNVGWPRPEHGPGSLEWRESHGGNSRGHL